MRPVRTSARAAMLLVAALAAAAVPGRLAAAASSRSTPCTSRTPSVFGFCIATLPQFYCCSSAYTGWSHIYVGETVDVRGAVPPLTSGQPSAKDAYIVSPSGHRFVLPVEAGGDFSETITFGEPGTWHMGLDPNGPGSPWSNPYQQAMPFQVAYRAVPQPSQTLAAVFGPDAASWSGIQVIAAPVGARLRLRVRFVDALGRPAADRRLRLNGQPVETDSNGYADIPFRGAAGYMLDGIYPGLFVQTYSRVAIQGDRVVGLARYYGPGDGPPTASVIDVRGTAMVDVAGFLLYGVADLFQNPLQGPPAVAFDATSGVLKFPGDGGLDTKTGLFTWRRWTPGGYRLVSARLHPVVRGSGVYLSLPDLGRLLSLLPAVWVRPLPDGSMLFSTFEVP